MSRTKQAVKALRDWNKRRMLDRRVNKMFDGATEYRRKQERRKE